MSGTLDGPACGACGRRHLDAPDEFLLNGANARPDAKTKGVRLIPPVPREDGARLIVSAEHVRQRDRSEVSPPCGSW